LDSKHCTEELENFHSMGMRLMAYLCRQDRDNDCARVE